MSGFRYGIGSKSPLVILILLLSVASLVDAFAVVVTRPFVSNLRRREKIKQLFATIKEPRSGVDNTRLELLNLLSQVPPNEPTPKQLTESILQAVKVLEDEFPTPPEDVLGAVAGNWELLWTAQDLSRLPKNRVGLRSWVNPLENQSYSNNPLGRSNPLFPRNIQDNLEEIGVLKNSKRGTENTIKSTQSIDLKRGRVRNVVVVEVTNPTPFFSKKGVSTGFITVDVSAVPNADDVRKIDVKFNRCQVAIQESPFNLDIGLGVFGPSGWLRTIFVDDVIRITRGHKGSVFILSRKAKMQERRS